MIICAHGSRQYHSDISCEKIGSHFVVATSGLIKTTIRGTDGVSREVELLLTPSTYNCNNEDEVLARISSLRREGYIAPDWIDDCIELSRHVNKAIN